MSIQKSYTSLIASYYKLIASDKIRFIIVGGGGFVVNFLSLALFYDLAKLPIVYSQIVGAELALLTTFVGNNYWAFKDHHHVPFKTKLLKFHASALGGIVINSGLVVLLVHDAHLYYGLALIVGSAAGLVWNYTMYKHFVFKTSPKAEI